MSEGVIWVVDGHYMLLGEVYLEVDDEGYDFNVKICAEGHDDDNQSIVVGMERHVSA